MLKTKVFKTKRDLMDFLRMHSINIERIVLIAEKLNSCELIYR